MTKINEINNHFSWVYKIGFFIILALPILAVPPLFHPAAWGKTIVFRIIFSILIFFFIYQIIYHKSDIILEKLKSKPVKMILGILALLFVLSLLSTVFSPEKSFSFWGSPYRAGGFLNFAFYIIFAVLTFLILKPKDWKLIWNVSIGTALAVSIFSLLQIFGVFKEFLVSYGARMPGTLGSTIFLALYLSFFVFLSLSFIIIEKNKIKKNFYIIFLLLIAYVIFLSVTRAVFLGLLIGGLYFILFYPKKLAFLKIATLVLLTLGALGIYYINTPSEKISSSPFITKNYTLTTLIYKLKTNLIFEDPRFSYWIIAINSLKEKPLLGYGPENFSIGFDKYFDPSLPNLNYMTMGQVDRAHNFIFDTAVTMGIPALLTFLSLFGVIFWQLQKLKNLHKSEEISINQRLVAHGIQATLIAYFIGVSFSFDTFDTYLIFFLLVGYCLHLIYSNNKIIENQLLSTKINEKTLLKKTIKYRKALIVLLFFLLVLFIWQYNLKPLLINNELNWANFYSKSGECQKAIDKIEKVLPSHSFIDSYILLKYSDILKDCQKTNPGKGEEFTQKSIQILEKVSKLRPTYTRTWILLGIYHNLLVEKKQNLKSEEKESILSKAELYFNKALQLNPKGQQIFLELSDTYLLWGKYDEAKKMAEQCIKINANLGNCWLQKALSNIVLGELTQAKENIEKASQNKLNVNSKESLSQLLVIYLTAIQNLKNTNLEYYKPLIEIYKKLISLSPDNFQYHASLAYTYKTLGEYKKAREEAMIVIELSPGSKPSVEEFLRTLPY